MHFPKWGENFYAECIGYLHFFNASYNIEYNIACWSGGRVLMSIDGSQLPNWSTAQWDTIMDCHDWYAELTAHHLVTSRPSSSVYNLL